MNYRRTLLLCVSATLCASATARFEINGHTIDGQAIGGWFSSQQNKLKERMKDLKVQAVKVADTLKPKEQPPSEESPSPAASQQPSAPPSMPAQASQPAPAPAASGKSWLPFGLGELVGAVALAALVGLLLDEKRVQTVRSRVRELTAAWAPDAKPAAPPPAAQADEPPAAPAAITQRAAIARPSQEPGLMSYVDVSASAFGGGGGVQDPELMSYVDVSQAGLMGAASSQ